MSESVTLAPEVVEAIARRVVELLQEHERPTERRLVDAAELADLLGVTRHTVYEHATELGARRLSDGPRARLRFDAATALAAWTARGAQPEAQPTRRQAPRSTAAPLLPIRASETT